jgi:hypothetical protein
MTCLQIIMLLDVFDARCCGPDVDNNMVTDLERGLTLSAGFAMPDVVTDIDRLYVYCGALGCKRCLVY